MFQSLLKQKPGLYILWLQWIRDSYCSRDTKTLMKWYSCIYHLRPATLGRNTWRYATRYQPTGDLVIVSGVKNFDIFVKPFINIVPHQTTCQKTCDQNPSYKPLFHIYSWIIPVDSITWSIIKRPPFEEIVSLIDSVWSKIVNSTAFFGFYAIVLSSGEDRFPSCHNDLQPIVYDFKIYLLIAYVNDG